MYKISKEDIRNAFLTGQRKRNRLLYEYYKEDYFSKDYTARMIAAKISEDLGIPVSANMVFKIYARIVKQKKSALDNACQTTPVVILKNQAPECTGQETNLHEKVQKVFVFKNADEEPRKNPFEDAFKDL